MATTLQLSETPQKFDKNFIDITTRTTLSLTNRHRCFQNRLLFFTQVSSTGLFGCDHSGARSPILGGRWSHMADDAPQLSDGFSMNNYTIHNYRMGGIHTKPLDVWVDKCQCAAHVSDVGVDVIEQLTVGNVDQLIDCHRHVTVTATEPWRLIIPLVSHIILVIARRRRRDTCSRTS